MRLILKNQIKLIWKKWFNFIGIFILLFLAIFLTNGSLTVASNTNKIFNTFNYSKNGYNFNIKHFSFGDQFTTEGYSKINNYFFNSDINDKKFDFNENKEIKVDKNYDEIKRWNFDFRAWLLNKILKESESGFADNSIAVDYNYTPGLFSFDRLYAEVNYNKYSIEPRVGFNSIDWKFKKQDGEKAESFQQLKKTNLVYLTAGRQPKKENEVVVNISAINKHLQDLNINNKINIKGETFVIVGQGYTFKDYLTNNDDQKDQLNVYFLDSAFHSLKLGTISANYYVNIETKDEYKLAKEVKKYINYDSPKKNGVNIGEFHKIDSLLDNNLHVKLVKVEMILFAVFGLLLFAVTLFITISFLKKEVDQQSRNLGILMGMGVKQINLAAVISITFVTLAIVPILLGFGFSYLLQSYLINIVASVIYFPFQLVVTIPQVTIANLLIFPIILFFALTIMVRSILNRQPIDLIYSRKKVKMKQHIKAINKKSIISSINYRIGRAFIRGNRKKIVSTSVIFFLSLFVVFAMSNFVNTHERSLIYMNTAYTDYGNREYKENNVTTDKFVTALKNGTNFKYNNKSDYHWVSFENFQANIQANNGTGKIYQEIENPEDIKNLISDNDNSQKKFVKPEVIANNIDYILGEIKSSNKKIHDYIEAALPRWRKNNTFPYLTSGFRIYYPDSFLISSFKFEYTQSFFYEKYVEVDAVNSNELKKWVKLETANNAYALSELANKNESYINAIIPAQMARKRNMRLNSIHEITFRENDSNREKNKSFTIPIRVVGINNFNFASKSIIVDKNILFDKFIEEHNKLNTIDNNQIQIQKSQYDALSNSMLVRDKLPESDRNISLNNSNFTVDNAKYYFNSNYNPEYSIRTINNLIYGLKTLVTVILIMGIIVVLVLLYSMFLENRKDMLSLKFQGYKKSTIISLIIIPYLITFALVIAVVITITHFLVKFLAYIMFNVADLFMVYNFSIPLLGALFGIILTLIVVIFIVGLLQISKSSLQDLAASE